MRNVTKPIAILATMLAAGLATRASAQTWTFPEPTTPVNCAAVPTDLPLAKPGTLTMSINATIPPAQFIDKTGKLVGMNVDLGNELARRMCLKPEYANVAFEAQIPGLQNKRWDVIDTGLYYTPARAKIMYLVPYIVNSLGMVVPAGNLKAIKGPRDLAGMIVGVEVAGFEEKTLKALNEEQVKGGAKPMDIRVFNTYGDTFQALRAGQLDAVFAGDAVGAYYQKQGQFTRAVSGLYPGSPAAFATADKRVAEGVVAALAAMKADGTYDKMMDFYGVTSIDKWAEYTGKVQYYYAP